VGASGCTAAAGVPLAGLVAPAVVGCLLALLGCIPGASTALAWAVGAIPGVGILRDGQKFLAPLALLVAVAFALGVERLAAGLTRGPALAVLVAAAVFPLATLPDLALGGQGRFVAVEYPASWGQAATYLRRADAAEREMVVLPWGAYRRFPWNGDRTVLDPAPRFFPVRTVTDDTLPVGVRGVAGGNLHAAELEVRRVAGENPRAAEVGVGRVAGENRRAMEISAALADRHPLVKLGVRWVLVEKQTPGAVPATALAGMRCVLDSPELALYEDVSPG
jgi:hypothetical protein